MLCLLPSDIWECIFKYIDYSTDIVLVCKTLNNTIVEADFYKDYMNLLMKKIIYTQKHKIITLEDNISLLEGEIEHTSECTIEEFYHQNKYGVDLCICTVEYGELEYSEIIIKRSYSGKVVGYHCPECGDEVKKCSECGYRNIEIFSIDETICNICI